ncbi:MAG TPA: sigma-54-dependent Fis family transcriptional regulator [Rhodocyclaceae bacterium]|nr:MAG: transcriptional regulator [Betaproteobacteria bacterium CG2_30_68_42]PIV73096.1 MAG: sigma-54-dependent Fis family transcriptional regulator [Rhodocyclales bacterium CG17_big_fil_post_rev_8_21_14_2_50_68_7]PJA56832.1 MAG: sigma-54-dependent Fis family transcriptional regulator [Rhodocyclales bacterium CG_4_9_14_3_um_filter_68_10]HCX33821.1 sigma-54-dependent Fis family transcriptional regulator [Rhodocyclaceae bacterium]
MAQILVVDDEIGIRELLSEILRDEGYDVKLAANAAAARSARLAQRPDLVLLDIWMPDTDGITLLKEWSALGQLNMPVIMMSGHGTIDTAVEATRIGAQDFLEKPIALQKLLATVKNALQRAHAPACPELSLAAFPRSNALRELKRRIEQVAAKSRFVLLKTPAGGVVELAARTLQQPGRAFIDLSVSGNPLDLPALEAAAGGVLFVPELARLARMQQKNLGFAAERAERYNLRLVLATHEPVENLLRAGFDEALAARLFEAWVALPALAELRDDIPEIASRVLTRLFEAGDVPLRRLSSGALNAMRNHAWPGGWSELKAAVRSAALAAAEEEIGAEEMVRLIGAPPAPVAALPSLDQPLREAREAFERIYFEFHLRHDNGNMTRLAERTGLERTHLYRKLRQLGLQPGRRSEP